MNGTLSLIPDLLWLQGPYRCFLCECSDLRFAVGPVCSTLLRERRAGCPACAWLLLEADSICVRETAAAAGHTGTAASTRKWLGDAALLPCENRDGRKHSQRLRRTAFCANRFFFLGHAHGHLCFKLSLTFLTLERVNRHTPEKSGKPGGARKNRHSHVERSHSDHPDPSRRNTVQS